ncbi:MAG: 2OG-Fe(II) oxygenase [Roseiarcus sp.]
MPLLDLEAFRQAPLAREPFMYTVVPRLVAADDASRVLKDFPAIDDPGLLPVEATAYGPRFGELIAELQSEAVARAFSEKFDLDLVGRPTMITVRGRCQEKDGRIHTDSEAKLVTALLYFNDRWEAPGGRLRLLRGPDDLTDAIAEVPPDSGTLVAFRRSDRSFHGHEPFAGVRRYVMINWMASGLAARRELLRHHVSARAKRLLSHIAPRAAAAGRHG